MSRAISLHMAAGGAVVGNRILKMDNVRKTINYLKKNGISHAYYAAKERVQEERTADYCYMAPSQEKLPICSVL